MDAKKSNIEHTAKITGTMRSVSISLDASKAVAAAPFRRNEVVKIVLEKSIAA